MTRFGQEFPDAQPPGYVRVYDPYRGFHLQAHQTIRWTSQCFDVTGISTNSFGMRDRERVVQKTGPRAALLGDSFLRGFEVDNDHVLNRVLEGIRPGVEFLNFGESGYGTVASYETYLTLAARFRPDVVVYFLYANDLIDNHYLLRAWRAGVVDARPGFDNYPDLVRRNNEWTLATPANLLGTPASWPFRIWLRQHVTLYAAARQARDALASRHTVSGSNSKAGPTTFPAAGHVALPRRWIELAAYAPPANEYWTEAWEVTKAVMSSLARATAERGARLLVVEVPHPEVLAIEANGFARVTGVPQPPGFDPAYFFTTIETFLERESIPFINLERAYRARGVDPRTLYGCTRHWNQEGHRITAEIVAPLLDPL